MSSSGAPAHDHDSRPLPDGWIAQFDAK